MRLPVSWQETIAICNALAWAPLTSEVVDLLYQAAPIKVRPITLVHSAAQGTTRYMQAIETVRAYNARMNDEIAAAWQRNQGKPPNAAMSPADFTKVFAELAQPQGKTWIASNRNRHLDGKAATTYGWHNIDRNGRPIQGLGPDGTAPAHDLEWTDYSQTLVPVKLHARNANSERVNLVKVYQERGILPLVLKPFKPIANA